MPTFTCATCGDPFDVPARALAKYPGWTPRTCQKHAPARKQSGATSAISRGRRGQPDGARLTPAQVLATYADPGQDGVFTDGCCMPNPGPGGWGAVWIEGGRIIEERHGHDPATTNNRMELTALIEAYRLLPADSTVRVHSDSNLCVQTVRTWGAGWAARGWKRKDGPIANVDLVRQLWELAQAHPDVELVWIRAHAGHRWNEYADALAALWQSSASPPRPSEQPGYSAP